MLRLLLSKHKDTKDFGNIESLSCWYLFTITIVLKISNLLGMTNKQYNTNWIALTECSRISTHMPGFQSFFSFFASCFYCKFRNQQHKDSQRFHCMLKSVGCRIDLSNICFSPEDPTLNIK